MEIAGAHPNRNLADHLESVAIEHADFPFNRARDVETVPRVVHGGGMVEEAKPLPPDEYPSVEVEYLHTPDARDDEPSPPRVDGGAEAATALYRIARDRPQRRSVQSIGVAALHPLDRVDAVTLRIDGHRGHRE